MSTEPCFTNEDLPQAPWADENAADARPAVRRQVLAQVPAVDEERAADGLADHEWGDILFNDGDSNTYVCNIIVTNMSVISGTAVCAHFPMQNREKMLPSRSSAVIFPVISPKWYWA